MNFSVEGNRLLLCIKKDCFKKLQYWSTGGNRIEYSLILKPLFPPKLPDASFINSESVVRLPLLNLWPLLNVMLRCTNLHT
jgi:hypothetical protein